MSAIQTGKVLKQKYGEIEYMSIGDHVPFEQLLRRYEGKQVRVTIEEVANIRKE